MPSDRARVSYDPSRQWRGVIGQQGRPIVEADWNEAAAIDHERDRLVTLDVVGPVGTPDQGYGVTAIPAGAQPPATPGDLTIGPGTLYLGGERLSLEAAVSYLDQPDWCDYSTDPLWVAPAAPEGTASELVYLLAFEQEVSAVEDPALADVALGGPDTMQRQRILQHVVRQPTTAATCGDAWSGYVNTLAGHGLAFDQASMMVESASTLQVSFTNTPGAPGPCQPVATGGYLGAENQMLRVMVTDAEGPAIVWGFDDASFLYQVQSAKVDTGSETTILTLASAPVDSYHYPAAGQAVELLRDAVQLTDGGYIAAATGFVTVLAASYDPAQMQLVLSGLPPQDYTTAATQQLYLRVWQSTATSPAGVATELGGTGVAVTLASSTGTFHAGDFWRFALRPIQPQIVYPARYLDAPQPPDGPRTWACPLAVLAWDGGSATPSACVPPFSDLVELTGTMGGCCTVHIGPSDVSDGALLPLFAGYANSGPITVCLDPGTYTLAEPLLLGSEFSSITLQACSGGAVLQAPSAPGPEFTLGLIVIQGAGPVTIRGVELSVPLVGFSPAAGSFSGLSSQNQELMQAFTTGLEVAIGIYAQDVTGLTVADCTFSFPDPGQQNVFGAGIYATGSMDGVAVTGCTFQSANPPETTPFYDLTAGNQTEPPYQLTFGYLQEAIFQQVDDTDTSDALDSADGGGPLLHDAAIQRCMFQGVTVPVFAMTQLGTVRVDQNTVRNSYGGFWLYSVTSQTQLVLFQQLAIGSANVFAWLSGLGLAAIADRIVPIAMAMGQVLPSTPPFDDIVPAGRILLPSAAQLAQARQTLSTLYVRAGGASGTAAPTGAAAAAAAPTAGRAEARTAGEAGTEEAEPDEAAVSDLPPEIGIVFQPVDVGPPEPTIPVADTGTSVSLRFDLCDCQVDAVVAESYSGAALLLADLTQSAVASALVQGSRLRSRFPAGTVALGLWLAEGSVTGNIITNEVAVPAAPSQALPSSYSMALVDTAAPIAPDVYALAIAGNVLIDPALIPGQAWQPLNTVINYSVQPVVTGIQPTEGLVGVETSVTISGTGFTAATGVSFVSSTATTAATAYTVDSDTQITATSPPGSSGTVDITVTTPTGTSTTSTADQFTYVLPRIVDTGVSRAAEEDPAPPTAPMPIQRPRPEPDAD